MNLLSVCWDVTSACNLTCDYCYRVKNASMLDKKHWNIVISKLKKSGVRKIAIGGGEPLLVKQIDELLELSATNDIYTSIITNGTYFTPEKYNSIKNYLNEIVFSVDGGDAVTHSFMRGADIEEFDNIIKVIDYISKDNSKITLRVNSVVSKLNSHNLIYLGDKIKDTKLSYWRLMEFYPMNDANSNEIINKHTLSKTEWNIFKKKLIEKYGDEITLVFADNDGLSSNYFTISPDGNVFTSKMGEVVWLGSILEMEISELIDNPAFSLEKHYQLYSNWI